MMKKYLMIAVFVAATGHGFAQHLLIKPARTLSFTTNEGSYMSVDVSPDGKTLAFDLLGDLYTVPVGGGQATQLTHGMALHLHPLWSPDGQKIAYMSDNSGSFNLAIWDHHRKKSRILEHAFEELNYSVAPVWSPESNYITLGDTVYSLTGGKIISDIGIKHPIAFSPDGQYAYGIDSNKIYRYDQKLHLKTAISPVLSKFIAGLLSPDGHWWSYIEDTKSSRSLVVQDLVNNQKRVLVQALVRNDPLYKPWVPTPYSVLHYSFSPDSKNIYIAYGGKIHCVDVGSGKDQIIPFLARVRSDLGAFNYHTFPVTHAPSSLKYIRSASSSPDGKHIIFTARDEIYSMDLPHGSPHLLAPQSMGQFQPVYSPDGKWIAYTTWSDPAGGAVWRVRATGGRPERLTSQFGLYQCPAWSPDGADIAFITGDPKFLLGYNSATTGLLELITVNTGTVEKIEDSVPLINRLAFSADGNRIIFTPPYTKPINGNLTPQLAAKSIATKNTVREIEILASGTVSTYTLDKMISPDGRFIVYSKAEDLYLIPVGRYAGPTIISVENRLPVAIKFASGIDPHWENDGKILAWTYGNVFYKIDPEKIIAAAQNRFSPEGALQQENNFISVAVRPDQHITLDVKAPCAYAHGTIALKNVRIITMQGNKIIENGTVVIRNGRFTAIGTTGNVPIPLHARVLSLPGATIMPGLEDMHLHLHTSNNINQSQEWSLLANLAYGVTTARDPAASYSEFGYAERIRSGKMLGPRLYTVGSPVRIGDGAARLDNFADVQAVIQKRALMGAIVIKDYVRPPRLKRQWVLIASHAAGLNMTNEGYFDPVMQMAMIKDGSTGVEHNTMFGDLYQDMITFIAKSGTYFTPTLQVSSGPEVGTAKQYFNYKYWHQPDDKISRFIFSRPELGPTHATQESIEVIQNRPASDTLNTSFLLPARYDAAILHAGGRICMGSHGNDEGIGAHNEIWALQMGGMTNLEALQCATIRGAEALGIQHDLGSIEAGKIADVIVLNSNPLDDIHHSRDIKYVMKDGILYDGDTLDEIWPEQKKCPGWKLKTKMENTNTQTK